MTAKPTSTSNDLKFSESSQDRLAELKELAQEIFKKRKRRIKKFERSLTEQFDALAQQLSDEQALSADQATHEQTAADLQAAQEALEIAQSEWKVEQEENIATQQKDLKQRAEKLSEQEEAWVLKTAHVQEQTEYFEVLEEDFSERETQLSAAENKLIKIQEKLDAQAESLVKQEAALLVQTTVGQEDRTQNFETARLKAAQEEFLEKEATLRKREEQLSDENQQLFEELAALTTERDTLTFSLQERGEEPLGPVANNEQLEELTQEVADLTTRLKMAIEDVHALKDDNKILEEKLKSVKPSEVNTVADTSGLSGWEAQKQQLMASLWAAEDGELPEQREERLTIEETIKVTDQVIVQNTGRIAQLKAEIETLEKNALEIEKEKTEGLQQKSEEIAEIFDADEIIQNQRKHLSELEVEWEGKLRQAELELSVERAKIARERRDIEEKLCNLKANPLEQKTEIDALTGKKKRNWLSKLGLDNKEK